MSDTGGSLIVIDAGSSYTKAGHAGDDAPRAFFPSVVGYGFERPLVGDDAISYRDNLELAYPIKNGSVINWDGIKKILNHSFYDAIEVAPEEHPVLLAESVCNSKEHREKFAQILFETFNVPAIYIVPDAILSLYQSERTTGLVVDIGSTCTRVVPVVDGKCISNAISRVEIGGDHVTSYLMDRLGGKISARDQFELREILQDIKEKLCFVACDFAQLSAHAETDNEIDQYYHLPGGDAITLGVDRFRAPEVLFQPDELGLDCPGIQMAVENSIRLCPGEIQNTLCSNIVLSGGTTLLPGMADRLHSEVAAFANGMAVQAIAPANAYSTWVGGTFAAAAADPQGLWLSRQEYDESGPSIVHTKWT